MSVELQGPSSGSASEGEEATELGGVSDSERGAAVQPSSLPSAGEPPSPPPSPTTAVAMHAVTAVRDLEAHRAPAAAGDEKKAQRLRPLCMAAAPRPCMAAGPFLVWPAPPFLIWQAPGEAKETPRSRVRQRSLEQHIVTIGHSVE